MFAVEDLKKRHQLKKETINNKIANFSYNIYTHNLNDKMSKVNCAFINISAKKGCLSRIEEKLPIYFIMRRNMTFHLFAIKKT